MPTLLLLMLSCARSSDGLTVNRSSDATAEAPAVPTAAPAREAASDPRAPIQTDTLTTTNPSSGSKIAYYILTPEGTGPFPALVFAPGATHAGSDRELFAHRTDPYLKAGFALIYFDPEGRGNSEGTEDFNGEIGQDALAAVVRAAAADPRIHKGQIGLVSYSFGVALAAGALARHPDLPLRFFIDWEGPTTRQYVTGCTDAPKAPAGRQAFADCSDDAWWKPREAVNQIGKIKVPYWRLQFKKDHVQPTYGHTVEIVKAAEKAGVDVRVNDMGKSPKISSDADIVPLDNAVPAPFAIAGYAVTLMNETVGTHLAPPEAPPTRPERPPGERPPRPPGAPGGGPGGQRQGGQR